MSTPANLPGVQAPHPARHLFSIAGLTLATLFILGSFFVSAFYLRGLIAGNQLAAVIVSTLVDLTNEDRSADSLGTLSINTKLQAAAQAKADDMAAKGYFAHTSPDGRTSWSWFKDAGYSFSYAGENLAVDFSDSKDVEDAWMNSPTHRANILNGKFTEIGIATAEGEYQGKKAIFVVQMFGRPSLLASTNAPTTEGTPAADEIAVASTEPVPTQTSAPVPSEVLGSSVPAPVAPAASAIVPAAVAAEVAAPTPVVSTPAPSYASFFDMLAGSPQNLLRALYLACALVVLLALVFTTELEFKKHHLRHVVAAVFLLALMGGLFTVADRLVFIAPVVGYTAAAPIG
jgi:hypothetical protein